MKAYPESSFLGMPRKVSESLAKESDRGAILILAAYLEEILSLIVRAKCTSDQLGGELLKFRNPAGDFSSKILLCEAFGLISKDEAGALNTLRKIRNKAAHFDNTGRGFDVLFDSADTINQVKRFLDFQNIELRSKESTSVRRLFQFSCRLLSTKLYLRLLGTARADALKSSHELAKTARDSSKGMDREALFNEVDRLTKEGRFDELEELLKSVFPAFYPEAD